MNFEKVLEIIRSEPELEDDPSSEVIDLFKSGDVESITSFCKVIVAATKRNIEDRLVQEMEREIEKQNNPQKASAITSLCSHR